ncbi:MAG: archaellin/type IV pilin N-terminal domain-containing protein [Candidatus Pacearchaeota archaeon]
MKNKRAQSEIITTVLIILLVLAAIVIVWQVINSTVTEGGNQVTSGASCVGIGMEVAKGTVANTYIIKRTSAGEVFEGTVTETVLINGQTATKGATTGWGYTINPTTANLFKDPLTSATITVTEDNAAPTTAITKVEAALKVDGDVCGSTGTLTI